MSVISKSTAFLSYFRIIVLAALGLAAFIPYGSCAAEEPNWGPGPVVLENQYPLTAFHSSWAPRSPGVVAQGSVSGSAHFALSNSAIIEDFYQVDVETRNFYGALTWSPMADLEVALSVPIVWRGPGDMDSFIDSWHEFWGLPEGDRPDMPDDMYTLSGLNEDQRVFSVDDGGPEIGNIKLRSKYLLTRGTASAPAWAVEFEAGLPAVSGEFGHDGIDATIGIIGAKRWNRFGTYWGASYIYFSDTRVKEVEFRSGHVEGFAAAEYMILENTSLYLALYAGSEIIESVIDHPGHFLYLDMGGKIALNDVTKLEILVRENPTPSDGSVDVTAALGVSFILS